MSVPADDRTSQGNLPPQKESATGAVEQPSAVAESSPTIVVPIDFAASPQAASASPPRSAPDTAIAGANQQTLMESSSRRLLGDLATGPRQFGGYELLQVIARGGMGIVFKARQIELDRPVALKLILAGEFASEEDVKRFRTEASAAAKLHHEHIVQIYDFGEAEGQHFFTMDFIPGASLQDRIHQGPLLPHEAARIARDIARGMAHAHAHHVIHRDLKPANILLDEQGRAKITDFGLAKRVQQESGLTRTGQIMGTPGYMPPEQALGHTAEVGPASDIYSIGGILYAMLTSRPPFASGSLLSTLRSVIEQEPTPPRQLNAEVPRELEAIVLKCLQKTAKKRYVSAAALADDLDRFLAGERVVAKSRTSMQRGAAWVSRRRAVLGALAAVVVVAVALIYGLSASRPSPYAELRRREVEQIVERFTRNPPQTIDAPEPSRRDVAVLPVPNTAAFEPLDRLRVFDFRAWLPGPSDPAHPRSPVTVSNRERFRKRKPVDELRFESRTSGYDVYSRCDSHPGRFHVEAEQSPSIVGGQSMKARQVVIDVSDVPVGQEFEVATHATFWDAFQSDEQRWVGTMVRDRPFKVSFLIIFPENHPYTDIKLRVADIDGSGIRPYEGEQLILRDPQRRYLFWEIVEPMPQHVYRVDWEW